jgi:hypothetical protein
MSGSVYARIRNDIFQIDLLMDRVPVPVVLEQDFRSCVQAEPVRFAREQKIRRELR